MAKLLCTFARKWCRCMKPQPKWIHNIPHCWLIFQLKFIAASIAFMESFVNWAQLLVNSLVSQFMANEHRYYRFDWIKWRFKIDENSTSFHAFWYFVPFLQFSIPIQTFPQIVLTLVRIILNNVKSHINLITIGLRSFRNQFAKQRYPKMFQNVSCIRA